jgi:hypothetical protein
MGAKILIQIGKHCMLPIGGGELLPQRTPQMHTYTRRCVVCKGNGIIWGKRSVTYFKQRWMVAAALTCDTCDGFGYLPK